jgi:membrane protease YdiL (CAAX protease family)
MSPALSRTWSLRLPTRTSEDPLAGGLRGFGPLGIIAMLVIVLAGNVEAAPMLFVPIGGVLVLAWVRLSRTPWSAIGYVRPKSWIGAVVVGLVFGAAFKILMKAIVMPLLGADPINQTYHVLVGNRALLPAAVLSMIVGGGFGEETVFRGFLFERFGKLFGSSVGARISIVLLTSAVFSSLHYMDQGFAGLEQAIFTGIVFGTIFSVTRSVFLPMCAHAAFDVTAIAIIYWSLESTVAHLVFK